MQDIRLNNPQQVKRLINRTINQLLKGEIETDKARCIGYLGSILLKATEVEDMAERMNDIEIMIKKGA